MIGDGPKYLRSGSRVVDVRDTTSPLRVVRREPPRPKYKRLHVYNVMTGRTSVSAGPRVYLVEAEENGAQFHAYGFNLARVK